MKKTEFKERIENARNAFFEDEFFDADVFLSYRSRNEFLQSDDSKDFVPKISNMEIILKQVFLFFPGTFILYIFSMVFTMQLVDIFIGQSGRTLRGFEFVGILAVLLAATLMTWLGLGDLRKPKHLVIPASIVGVSIFFLAFVTVLMIFSNEVGMHKFINNLAFYFFPLALIVPFLAKGWVDRNTHR